MGKVLVTVSNLDQHGSGHRSGCVSDQEDLVGTGLGFWICPFMSRQDR